MKDKEQYSIGVDLGGTNIKIGLVSKDGKIVKKDKVPTNAGSGPESVVSQIKLSIHNILRKNDKKIKGIGIGSPGTVTLKGGVVEYPPNLPGWEKVRLGDIISKEFELDTYVENDANAAAIGEMIFGNGKKLNSFIMVTLGTGVGGGIVFKRKLFRGEHGSAGEIGHMTIDYSAGKCNCGSFGCVETFLGNHYIINSVRKKLPENMHSSIWKLIDNNFERLSPRVVQQAAEEGDSFAKQVINDLGFYLGCCLASTADLLDISTFIIGGGVAGFGKPLFHAVEKAVETRVLRSIQERVKILPAKLRNDAGIKGASALVYYKLGDI